MILRYLFLFYIIVSFRSSWCSNDPLRVQYAFFFCCCFLLYLNSLYPFIIVVFFSYLISHSLTFRLVSSFYNSYFTGIPIYPPFCILVNYVLSQPFSFSSLSLVKDFHVCQSFTPSVNFTLPQNLFRWLVNGFVFLLLCVFKSNFFLFFFLSLCVCLWLEAKKKIGKLT